MSLCYVKLVARLTYTEMRLWKVIGLLSLSEGVGLSTANISPVLSSPKTTKTNLKKQLATVRLQKQELENNSELKLELKRHRKFHSSCQQVIPRLVQEARNELKEELDQIKQLEKQIDLKTTDDHLRAEFQQRINAVHQQMKEQPVYLKLRQTLKACKQAPALIQETINRLHTAMEEMKVLQDKETKLQEELDNLISMSKSQLHC
jgi:hypothetical protein